MYIIKKIEINAFIYLNNKRKIKYIFNYIKNSIFDVEKNLIFEFFLKEIKNYINIHYQKKTLKKIFIVKINKNKIVSKYYYKLFKL